MIKFETLGMNDVAKINPVLTADADVENYSFFEADGITYIIANSGLGDAAQDAECTIKAGEYMRGYDLSAHINQKFVIELAHTDYDLSDSEAAPPAIDDILTIDGAGLVKAESAPESGLYFKVTDVGCMLTAPAIKAVVCVGA